jgi:AcrR family transcriptional regulator
MATKRKYELKKRAEQLAETRRRIIETTVELHRTVGPAATRISEVARRAGVQRVTVYNHFPDDASLFAACSAHWRDLHPAPDPTAWGGDLRTALRDLYAWYRETEPMTANVLRDAQSLPALQAIVDGGLGAYLGTVREVLAKPFGARGRRRERIHASLRAALDFHFWRALAPLGDAEAARLAAAFVESAAI